MGSPLLGVVTSDYTNKMRKIVLDISRSLLLQALMEDGKYWYSYNLLMCGACPV